jgi:uncharacterized protein YajQ (UPF0234 family)
MTAETFLLLEGKTAELSDALIKHLSARRDARGVERLLELFENERVKLAIDTDELVREMERSAKAANPGV